MIRVYTGFKGFAFFLLSLLGLILGLSMFFWGITKVVELLLPLLIVASYAVILIFLLGILPASLNRPLRPRLSSYAIMMSHALGAATWVLSFMYVVKAFGFWGICLSFFLQFLAPLALLGAVIKGAWTIAEDLSVWIAFRYIMKFYSQWLMSVDARPTQKTNIIDVDVVEVHEGIEE